MANTNIVTTTGTGSSSTDFLAGPFWWIVPAILCILFFSCILWIYRRSLKIEDIPLPDIVPTQTMTVVTEIPLPVYKAEYDKTPLTPFMPQLDDLPGYSSPCRPSPPVAVPPPPGVVAKQYNTSAATL
ncbi:uncharacterized protein BJ171DRAFT_581243 [Polychytrium aggregatum]|uniref:uncharacterized protein n=1 Tax=Polychytrium aggregatum TaxID=110093 RepID=UPI0022FE406E|nr:uncharacterized protein BJ171DRAFT_581243 [Polychytrium aggregatum]KAI9205032.1 hypothetical protein BJ171DRAFT_581243 [Polychytrium aggregatum]